MPAKNTDRRWLPLLLLLLPFLCAGIAYAARLQISSPYFTLRFGPPDVFSGTNGSGDPSADLPATGGEDGVVLDVPDVRIDATNANTTCFLNVLCITATAQADSPITGDTDSAIELDGDGASINNEGPLPDEELDLDVDTGSQDGGLQLDLNGPGDLDADASAGSGGVDLNLPLDELDLALP